MAAPRFWDDDSMGGLLDDLLGNVLGGGLDQQGARRPPGGQEPEFDQLARSVDDLVRRMGT